MGAVASGGTVVLNDDVVRHFGVSAAAIQRVVERERRELERRERRYRGDRPLPEIAGNTVILVDDGLATGSTMLAAVRAIQQEHPRRLVVAVPVGAPETCDAFRSAVDDVVCGIVPDPFHAVGLWYDDFAQTSDEEVHELLDIARELPHGPNARAAARGGAEGAVDGGGARALDRP